jgi:hypothetical protein
MARFEIGSEQAVSDWTRSEWVTSLIPPTLLLFFIYLSKDNLALLTVWIAVLLTVVFASTLSNKRTIFNWNARQVKTYTVWGRMSETIHFDQLDHILISCHKHEFDDKEPTYSLTLSCKASFSMILASDKSMTLIQDKAELLATHLRQQEIDIEIKQDFDSASKRSGNGIG